MTIGDRSSGRLTGKGKRGFSASGVKKNFILDTGNLFRGAAGDFDSSYSNGKLVFSIIVAALSILLQEALFNDLRIFGVKPNILMASVVLISMSSEPLFAPFLGLFSGLAVDVSFGRYIGFYGLIYMYFCAAASAATRPRFKGRLLYYVSVSPLLLFIFTLVSGFGARFLSLYASRAPALYEDFAGHLLSRILPSTLYTYMIFLLLLLPVTLALRRLGREKKKVIDFRN